jgi:DNA-binding NarL/FixJ family response regulator
MPEIGGIDLISIIKKQYPKIKVVVLTVDSDETKVLAALNAGADGYILKEIPFTQLVNALRCIMNGKRYLSSEVSKGLGKDAWTSCS